MEDKANYSGQQNQRMQRMLNSDFFKSLGNGGPGPEAENSRILSGSINALRDGEAEKDD